MSVSIEALAMAGADYRECNIDVEEWEREEIETTPSYLLAEEDEEDVNKLIKFNSTDFHPLWPCLSQSSFSSFWDDSFSSSSSTSDSDHDDNEADDDEFRTVYNSTYVSLAGIIKNLERAKVEDSHIEVSEDDTQS